MSSDDDNSGPSWSTWGNSTCLPPDSPDALWPYCPSEGAAVLFTVLFFMAMSVHIFLAIKFRKAFCWVLIMGTSWEMAGFGFRVASTQFQQSMAMYVPQLLFILLAPLWINAFVYMLFARLVYCYDPQQKAIGIRATRLGVLFVCLDIVAFIVQLAGASMLTSTDPNQLKWGKNIYMSGIGFQESFLLGFSVCVILFHRRNGAAAAAQSKLFHRTLYSMYAALTLITVRIIFRLVEYSQGFDAPIVHTESYQYIFDAVPMLFASCLFMIYHPGRVLQGPNGSFPSRKEKKAAKQQAKALKKEAKAARKAQKNGLPVLLEAKNGSEEEMLPMKSFVTSDALESQNTEYRGSSAGAADIGYTAPYPGPSQHYQHYQHYQQI